MTNPYSGEVTLVIDGEPRVLKLTLGALAELEASLSVGTLVALAERFETTQVSARDVVALLVAGLRGGGWVGQAPDLLLADIEGGPMAATGAASELLRRAFSFGGAP